MKYYKPLITPDVAAAPLRSLIGAEVRRREDPALVQGAGRFVDDLVLPHTAAMAVLRSPHAHARIRRVDTGRAATLPGVLAILTARDVDGHVNPEPDVGIPPNARRPARPLLARDVARYVGEPIAVVVAENRYVAADACEAIQVDYDPLPVVADPHTALAPDAPRVHAEFPDNVALRWSWTHGDVDGAFARARHVVRLSLVNQRVAGMALEPRGCLAEWRNEMLTLWAGTQTPHRLRSGLAEILRVPESALRVIAPNIGGGFGCKIGYYRDEALCAVAAMRLGRPVRLVLTRREDFLTNHPGPRPGERGRGGGGRGRDRARALLPHARRSRGLPGVAHAVPGNAHRAAAHRALPDPRGALRASQRLHECHGDRALPGRRPAGGHVPARAHDGRRRLGLRCGPGRDAPAQPDPPRGVPIPRAVGPRLRLRAIGQALWEHMAYDASGQCLTASLMDYAAPKSDVLPSFVLDRIETLTPVNPLGAKGCGEAGTIGSTPAVVNAVLDALAPFRVTHLDMPLTPARVWTAIHAR
jgi:CO/xanthine dehydrogenase Mo-binding subunit